MAWVTEVMVTEVTAMGAMVLERLIILPITHILRQLLCRQRRQRIFNSSHIINSSHKVPCNPRRRRPSITGIIAETPRDIIRTYKNAPMAGCKWFPRRNPIIKRQSC